MSQSSILYLIRHASVILIGGIHLLKRVPTSEHCWKKNNGAQWAGTCDLLITDLTRSQLSYVGLYVESDIDTMLNVNA